MQQIDIGSLVCVVGDESGTVLYVREMRGCELGCCDPEGGLQWFTRDQVELAPDDDTPAAGDTAGDQFTGSDMGAEMATAEGGA